MISRKQGVMSFGGLLAVALALGCGPVVDPGPIGGEGMCGGILGAGCPGEAQCVDDPSDDCDPENGGADCTGVCECTALGSCIEGSTWDSSPGVCGCVSTATSCAAVTCVVGTTCVEVPGGPAQCVIDPCGGFECPAGQHCTAPADAPYCTDD